MISMAFLPLNKIEGKLYRICVLQIVQREQIETEKN